MFCKRLASEVNIRGMEKIIFFGGGKFAVPSLSVLAKKFNIALVVTNPEKPIGRKQIPEPSAVEIEAKKLGLPVTIAEKFDNIITDKIQAANPSFFIIIDYGKIIPQNILDIPPKGAINVHPSALPKYRGASPLQTAILNGDKETAITVMLADNEMDHGPILAQKKITIEDTDTYGSLYTRLSTTYPKFLITTAEEYLSGELKPKTQEHSKATFTKLLKRGDGHIDWNKSAEEIERMVRAYNPWPGTFYVFNQKNVKIIKSTIEHKNYPDKKISELFKTADKKLAVKCGQETLIIDRVQPAGKRPMSGEEFARGYLK